MTSPEMDPDEAYERAQERKIEDMVQADADSLAEEIAADERLGLIPDDDDYWEEAHCHEWEGR